MRTRDDDDDFLLFSPSSSGCLFVRTNNQGKTAQRAAGFSISGKGDLEMNKGNNGWIPYLTTRFRGVLLHAWVLFRLATKGLGIFKGVIRTLYIGNERICTFILKMTLPECLSDFCPEIWSDFYFYFCI